MASKFLTPPGGRGTLELLDRLGVGGVAEVFRAVRRRNGAPPELVVIKKMRADVAADPFFSDRFMAEADLVKMIRHPNVVGGDDVGMLDGLPYVVMDYVDGKDLGTVVKALHPAGTILPHSHGVYVVLELLRGLGHVHRLKTTGGQPLRVVHRDVTPDNVLLSYTGDVRLTDFGIALMDGLEADNDDKVAGKLGYLSPEQALKQPLDQRSDLFAVGCILYELTVGRPAFAQARGESEAAALSRVQEGRFVRPTKVLPDFPKDLEAVILKALEKRPDKRFQEAVKFMDALDELSFQRQGENRMLGEFLRRNFAGEYARMRVAVPPV